MTEHGGEELPGGSGGFAPGSGDGEQAIGARIRIVVKETGVAGQEGLEFIGRGVSGFEESAFGGDFGARDEIGGRNEIKFV